MSVKSKPLQDDGPKLNVDDLLFFPAKELNESNIGGRRSPPRLIRLGIGSDGVYKFERDEDKVLAFWGYSDIEDWSFSGYSFTLSFKNKRVYHVRTDDGQAISHWVDSFTKNPDQALVASKQFKSLGVSGTMRKFSAELKPINYQAKFYTLNPRRTKHSIDQSRMLSAYGVDRNKTKPQSLPRSQNPTTEDKDQLRWSTGTSLSPKTKTEQQSLPSDNKASPRAQSMDSLLNGVHEASNDYFSSPPLPHRKSSVPHQRKESPPPKKMDSSQDPSSNGIVHNPIPPPKLLRRSSSDKEESNEQAPAVPPRRTSLGPSPSDDNVLIKVNEDELKSPSPMKWRPHTYEDIEMFGSAVDKSNKSYDHLSWKDKCVQGSGEYDHLFPNKKTHKNAIRRKKNSKEELGEEEEVVKSPIRRNESLPPMNFHSPLLEKPTVEVTPSDEGELSLSDDEAPSPLPPHGGVILRRKREEGDSDPFADLLAAPPSKSHLRWSQELNPIYDYVRGIKVSPTVGYDLMTKPEEVILEEDIQQDEETVSIGSSSGRRSSSESGFEPLVYIPQSAPNTLQRMHRRPHNYEEVVIGGVQSQDDDRPRLNSKGNRPHSEHYNSPDQTLGQRDLDVDKSATLVSQVRKLKSSESTQFVISPRLNKRVIHRRSKTVKCSDDFKAPHGVQRAQRVADTMKDFSYINRDYRVFFIKLPNGQLISEVVNINRPVSVLIDKLMNLLGGTVVDSCCLYVEGSILTTMKEATLEFGEVQSAKAQVDRSVSLTQLVDNNSLADQGNAPILLKNALSFRMQGITTSRILRLDDADEEAVIDYNEIVQGNDFHKRWLAVVQGNQPCTLEAAVKLAAIQYQAYFLERTAENSVIGFCRPNEFLPAEFAGMRGIEQRMYKEQEKIKSKSHIEIQKFYIKYASSLATNDTVFFPVREPRRRLLQNTRLKPVLLGVNKNGIMRVCPKSKEVLDFWEYQVLKNWAYSRRTFVVAFNNKNYPVESNQAKWISELVDFFVESILHSSHSLAIRKP